MQILLTGYKARTSVVQTFLSKVTGEYDTYFFTSNFVSIQKETASLFQKNHYDYVILFGRKPRIKRPFIELEANGANETLSTNFPLEELFSFFNKKGITYKTSTNPGISYCNCAYYYVLKYVYENHLNTKVVFIHIPFAKNFCDIHKFALGISLFIQDKSNK